MRKLTLEFFHNLTNSFLTPLRHKILTYTYSLTKIGSPITPDFCSANTNNAISNWQSVLCYLPLATTI